MTTEQNVSPAQELRAAASKIRDTAAFAASGKWDVEAVYGLVTAGPTAIVCTANGRSADRATALHIALWNPGVAELVAEWLDVAAGVVESMEPATDRVIAELFLSPLALARAINGGVA